MLKGSLQFSICQIFLSSEIVAASFSLRNKFICDIIIIISPWTKFRVKLEIPLENANSAIPSVIP